MAELDPKLLGAWERTSEAECAAGYAARLHFQHNGLYFGSSEPAGAFTWGDGGTWRVIAPGQLALSTANDAVVTYAYRFDNQQLTFIDPAGCRLSYRRSA